MVVSGKLCANVKSFKCVQVRSVFVAMQYLHDTVHGAEGVSFFIKVFSEAGIVEIVSECHLVLFETSGEESPVCPTYALWHSGQMSLYTPDSENLSGVGFPWESRFPMVFVVRNVIFRFVFLKRFVMYHISLTT